MIDKLLGLQNQLRMLHWGTNSYAEHKALGKLYETLDPLIDQFMEMWMGINGKTLNTVKLVLEPYNTRSSEILLEQAIQFFKTQMDSEISNNSDLSNIRDEMLAAVNQTKYLLTLK